ncbi:TPA: hypothetical protein N0G53_006046 [Pseudomonas aeruginosa]|nr:hypothetical protein [Pseudomonas aeruginosa]
MPSIKPFGLALLVLGLSACASLGQSGNRDNEVKVAAQKLGFGEQWNQKPT